MKSKFVFKYTFSSHETAGDHRHVSGYQMSSSNVSSFVGTMQEFSDKCPSNRLVVCFFTIPTCPACRQAKACIKSLYEENPDVVFYELSIDNSKDVFDAMNVKQCPCFVLLKGKGVDGMPKEVTRQLGWNSQDLRMKINQFI